MNTFMKRGLVSALSLGRHRAKIIQESEYNIATKNHEAGEISRFMIFSFVLGNRYNMQIIRKHRDIVSFLSYEYRETCLNLMGTDFFFQILAHPVFKM